MKIRSLKKFKRIMTVPPDKSITHRALILGAMAKGSTVIKNPLTAIDAVSTVKCIRALGAEVKFGAEWVVKGGNLKGANLDCGNSGTTMRLLMGVAATLPTQSVFTGDKSLRSRPMDRILKPLSLMGATCDGLKISGGNLRGIDYELPTSSAQVKSGIILAALSAEGETVLRGRTSSRNHTETMVAKMGGDISENNGVLTVKKSKLSPTEFTVPGDPSSAAFAATLALLIEDGYAYIRGVCDNFTRNGFFRVLLRAGCDIEFIPSGEEKADIVVKNSKINLFTVDEAEIPYMIDELPLLALIACFAVGKSVISGVGELKFKESNRIAEIEKLIRSLGGEIYATPTSIEITGKGSLAGGGVYDGNDHRMVMTAAVAYATSQKEGVITHPEAVEISYPEFFDLFD